MKRPFAARVAAALALALGTPLPATAHDTWFAPGRGDGALTLGTGNRFPVMELAVDDRYFARHGCLAADGAPRSLRKLRFADTATHLQAQPGAALCFVQLEPFDIDLPPDKVRVYFDEIRPEPAAVAAWERLRARGLPFRERYVKSARVEIDPAAATRPAGLALDAVRLAPQGALSVGAEAEFQILRDGRPLPDFNVELVNERSAVGLWHRTDAQGRLRARLPLPGRWLLRGTELRVADGDDTRFESRFVTVAFEVRRAGP